MDSTVRDVAAAAGSDSRPGPGARAGAGSGVIAAVIGRWSWSPRGIDGDSGAGGGVGRAPGAGRAAAGECLGRRWPWPATPAAGRACAAARARHRPASWTDSAARACRGTARRACDRPAAGRRDTDASATVAACHKRVVGVAAAAVAAGDGLGVGHDAPQLRPRRRMRTVEPQRLDTRHQPLVVAARRRPGRRRRRPRRRGRRAAAQTARRTGAKRNGRAMISLELSASGAGFRAWRPGRPCRNDCRPRRSSRRRPARRGPCRRRRSTPGRPPPSCRPAARRG